VSNLCPVVAGQMFVFGPAHKLASLNAGHLCLERFPSAPSRTRWAQLAQRSPAKAAPQGPSSRILAPLLAGRARRQEAAERHPCSQATTARSSPPTGPNSKRRWPPTRRLEALGWRLCAQLGPNWRHLLAHSLWPRDTHSSNSMGPLRDDFSRTIKHNNNKRSKI